MFYNKMLKVQSAREMLFPRLKCVCVCVRRALKLCPNDQIYTKHVKTAGLESLHLNSLCLKVNENSWEKIVCQYFVLATDWCFINVNQRTKCKEKITHSS